MTALSRPSEHTTMKNSKPYADLVTQAEQATKAIRTAACGV